jgi:hypothetical protein
MSGPYFQKRSWGSFTYQADTYDLTHLDEYEVDVTDSKGMVRRIAIGYSDHCFTREPRTGDDSALQFLRSTRPVGHFCVERYRLSLGLRQQVAHAMQRKVWNLQGENFAIVPTVNHHGVDTLYAIVFSLDRVKKLPVDLDMRVRTAYPCDIKDITTFGEVRFSHLVTLRIEGKSPGRNLDRRRPRPKLTWKPGQK